MAWLAGENLTAADLNGATTSVQSASNTLSGTTTATAYTDTLTGTTTVSQVFTTPKSGKICVTITAEIESTAAQYTLLAFRISGSAGTFAADDDNGTHVYGAVRVKASGTYDVEGLTPGATGTVTLQHRVTGGTGTFNRRRIRVAGVG